MIAAPLPTVMVSAAPKPENVLSIRVATPFAGSKVKVAWSPTTMLASCVTEVFPSVMLSAPTPPMTMFAPVPAVMVSAPPKVALRLTIDVMMCIAAPAGLVPVAVLVMRALSPITTLLPLPSVTRSSPEPPSTMFAPLPATRESLPSVVAIRVSTPITIWSMLVVAKVISA